MVLTIYYL